MCSVPGFGFLVLTSELMRLVKICYILHQDYRMIVLSMNYKEEKHIKKNIIGLISITAIVILIILLICLEKAVKKDEAVNFSKTNAPFTKSVEEQFTFQGTDGIEFVSKCCDMAVKKGKGAEITVKLYKKVGDKREEKLEEELKKITCKMTGNQLKIGYQDQEPGVNSCYVKAEITVPDTIHSIKSESNQGDVKFDGYYENMNLYSHTGDVILNLSKMHENGKYVIDGTIGNVKIRLPKNSKINLCGTQAEQTKLSKNIKIDQNGPMVELNKTVSDSRIVN